MKNLAGVKDCDDYIRRELTRCGIPVVECKQSEGEVAYSLKGELGEFTFERAWYYWVVNGMLPLNVAQELYADPVGKDDVRVNGHCGCPEPGTPGGMPDYYNEDGKILVDPEEWQKVLDMAKRLGSSSSIFNDYAPAKEDRTKEGMPFIDCYHIDSEVGLRFFADTLKKHQLVPC